MRRLVAVALVAGLASPMAAATKTRVPKLADCGLARVRPPTIVLACADAGFSLASLHWSEWQWAGAHGRGTAWRRCAPACADGHFLHWAVKVTLSRPHFCRRYDRVLFTRISWTAAGPVPKALAEAPTGTSRVPLRHYCP